MEKLDLEFNDYVSNIFVFVIRGGVPQYYLSDKSDWFMDGWPYLYGKEGMDYLNEALYKLADDKVAFANIKEEFSRLHNENKRLVMNNHLPMIYVDFDKKLLKSRYYEQSLHSRVLDDWNGSFDDFLDEIPEDYKYWKVESLI